jgi:hypothetical protein
METGRGLDLQQCSWQEVEEESAPCPNCNSPVAESSLDCPQCKNTIP